MLEFLRQWIIDTLGFSRSEANGTLILIFLVLAIAVLPKIYMDNTITASDGFIGEEQQLKTWAEELNAAVVKEKTVAPEPVAATGREPSSFPFDPNIISDMEFMKLGFSENAANNLVRYREKGGSFRVKADLKRIYGISEERLDELWEQIELPESYPVYEAKPPKEKNEKEPLRIEINSAKEEELQKVNGIGVKLSERIIKYRDLIGGFYSLDQLEEVYGLKPEVVASLRSVSTVSGVVHKININTDSARHLYNHPYIDYNIAYAIVNYRAQHGDFDSVTQLKMIKIIGDSLYQKIYPYLSLNQ